MENLLEAYAEDGEEPTSGDGETSEPTFPKAATSSLGELPADVMGMFADSEYDLGMERRRADERAGDTRWVRRFPHERGNWPTYVFIPVPNSTEFVRMAEGSVADFRAKLKASWEERHPPDHRAGKKRGRDVLPPFKHLKTQKGACSSTQRNIPPEVVMNDMTPSGEQHLSLSKTVVLRAHQIDPFVKALKDAVKSCRRFTASIVNGYDVLVNEDKSRSFVCLRVRGGRHLILQLIGKVDPVMERFKQPLYYEDPVVHVSVASVAGDMSEYVRSSTDDSQREEGSVHDEEDNSEAVDTREEVLSEICVEIGMVACKAGTTLCQAPFLPDR